jgi:NTE family protein
MYDAVEIDGQYYWDGGYSGNPLIQPLIDHTEIQMIFY